MPTKHTQSCTLISRASLSACLQRMAQRDSAKEVVRALLFAASGKHLLARQAASAPPALPLVCCCCAHAAPTILPICGCASVNQLSPGVTERMWLWLCAGDLAALRQLLQKTEGSTNRANLLNVS